MAKLNTNIPTNLTEYPNSFKRQGAFPLEAYSVFYNKTEAEEYASSNPIAYVGQILTVISTEEDGSTKVTHYSIINENGDLQEVASEISIDDVLTNEITDQVKYTAAADSVRYGVRRKLYNDDGSLNNIGTCERIWNDFTDVLNIYPYNEMKQCKIRYSDGLPIIEGYEDDDNFNNIDGDVFVEIPKFYSPKRLLHDDGYEYFGISKTKWPGWELNPKFINSDGTEKDYTYIAAYRCSKPEGKEYIGSYSKDGAIDTNYSGTKYYKDPTTNAPEQYIFDNDYTLHGFREKARIKCGSNALGIFDIADFSLLQELIITEYANVKYAEIEAGGNDFNYHGINALWGATRTDEDGQEKAAYQYIDGIVGARSASDPVNNSKVYDRLSYKVAKYGNFADWDELNYQLNIANHPNANSWNSASRVAGTKFDYAGFNLPISGSMYGNNSIQLVNSQYMLSAQNSETINTYGNCAFIVNTGSRVAAYTNSMVPSFHDANFWWEGIGITDNTARVSNEIGCNKTRNQTARFTLHVQPERPVLDEVNYEENDDNSLVTNKGIANEFLNHAQQISVNVENDILSVELKNNKGDFVDIDTVNLVDELQLAKASYGYTYPVNCLRTENETAARQEFVGPFYISGGYGILNTKTGDQRYVPEDVSEYDYENDDTILSKYPFVVKKTDTNGNVFYRYTGLYDSSTEQYHCDIYDNNTIAFGSRHPGAFNYYIQFKAPITGSYRIAFDAMTRSGNIIELWLTTSINPSFINIDIPINTSKYISPAIKLQAGESLYLCSCSQPKDWVNDNQISVFYIIDKLQIQLIQKK